MEEEGKFLEVVIPLSNGESSGLWNVIIQTYLEGLDVMFIYWYLTNNPNSNHDPKIAKYLKGV